MPTADELAILRALPLEVKIQKSKQRIREWLEREDSYAAFSGGKDSTVLAHLVHQVDPTVPLVFSNTGLEYMEIQSFARKMGAEFIRPEMRFDQVISTYGYPIISKEVAEAIYYARRIRNGLERETEKTAQWSRTLTTARKRTELHGQRETQHLYGTDGVWLGNRRAILLGRMPGAGVNWQTGAGGVFSNATQQFGEKSLFNKEKWLPAARDLPFAISHYCCQKMKKSPMQKYARQTGRSPIIGTLTEESRIRKQAWIRHGCNAFEGSHKQSTPLAFWTNQDILQYIKTNGLEICSVYGDVVEDGCNLRCSGCQRTGCVFCCFGAHQKDDRRFFELARISPRQYEYAIGGGQWVDNPNYDPAAPEYDGEWKNWNPKKIWVPSKQGLGLGKVITDFNELYPKNKILLP